MSMQKGKVDSVLIKGVTCLSDLPSEDRYILYPPGELRLVCRVLADIWKQGVQIEVS